MRKRGFFKKAQAAALIAAMSVLLLTACGGSGEKTADTEPAEKFSMQESDTASDTADEYNAVSESDMSGESDISGESDMSDGSDVMGALPESAESMESAVLDDMAAPAAKDAASKDGTTGDTPVDSPRAEAGLLTAGRWNDNDNWGYFTNLVRKGSIAFPSYGLNPCNRIAVTVKNSDGKPLPSRTITLEDSDGKKIWESVSDKNGTAYLFYNSKDKPAKVTAIKDDGSKESFDAITDKTSSEDDSKNDGKNKASDDNKDNNNNNGNGNSNNNNDKNNNNGNGNNGDNDQTSQVSDNSIQIVLDISPVRNKKTDIMFIMDATGSMTDEMTFLQEDFSKITREIGTKNVRYSVNFYRDEGDDYVTKCFDFSTDIDEIQKNINDQSADGGGDTPEAVAQILEESINSSSWDKDSVKLAFLIFDAPPHDGTDKKIYKSVKKASEMGIHFIPVVSSNAERDTELFGRALAICTNGEYVFLTDDSGIGDSHLEPIIGDYKVEPLYDIIVSIISEYMK